MLFFFVVFFFFGKIRKNAICIPLLSRAMLKYFFFIYISMKTYAATTNFFLIFLESYQNGLIKH